MKMVVRELKKKGIEASEELTIKKISEDNRLSPVDVYGNIREIVNN